MAPALPLGRRVKQVAKPVSRPFPQQRGPAGSFPASPGCPGDRGTVTTSAGFRRWVRVHSWSSDSCPQAPLAAQRPALGPGRTGARRPGGGGRHVVSFPRAPARPRERLLAPGRILSSPVLQERRIPVRLLQVIDACHVPAGSLLFTRTPQYVRSKNLRLFI